MIHAVRANLTSARQVLALTAALALTSSGLRAQNALDRTPGLQRAVVIDDQLESMIIEISSLNESALHYRTRHGRRRLIPMAQVLAIIPQPAINVSPMRPANMPVEPGLIMLTDGRRFAGALSSRVSGADESLAWDHEIFGSRLFSLEEVSWLVQPGASPNLKWDRFHPSSSDELILFNGDRLTGFVVKIGPEVTIEDGDSKIDVDAVRLSGARLANPPEPSRGMRVWLRDGTVAPLESIEIDEGGSVLMRLDGGPAHTEQFAPIAAVVFDAARLLPLASLEPVSQMPSEGRRFTDPSQRVASRGGSAAIPARSLTVHESPPLDAFDILLPGPLVLEYELPEGARRLSATASLDVGTSPWGDCEFIVRVEGVEMLRLHLSSQQPDGSFVVDTPGSNLTIEIDPGQYGPINDRVLIRRPLLLLDPAADR
jgi:hypothetical protein